MTCNFIMNALTDIDTTVYQHEHDNVHFGNNYKYVVSDDDLETLLHNVKRDAIERAAMNYDVSVAEVETILSLAESAIAYVLKEINNRLAILSQVKRIDYRDYTDFAAYERDYDAESMRLVQLEDDIFTEVACKYNLPKEYLERRHACYDFEQYCKMRLAAMQK